jgi:hypothetical protein
MRNNLILVGCLLVILTAYEPAKPSPILTDTSCEAPCWNLITPGETTTQQVIDILNQSDQVIDKSIRSRSSLDRCNKIDWKFENNGTGTITTCDGLVTMIGFGPKVKESIFDKEKGLGVTFSGAIDRYGEPESILSNSGLCNFDTPCVYLWALYPQKGIVYSSSGLQNTEDSSAELKKDTPVFSIIFFLPKHYDDILYKTLNPLGASHEMVRKYIYSWKGFGKVEEKYPLTGQSNKY